MPKKKTAVAERQYIWPHSRYKKATDKEWLEGRFKYPTGFCSAHIPLDAQGHEGTKPFTNSGTPVKVCPFYETCPCSCHYEIDMMYKLAKMDRRPPEQTVEYAAALAELRERTEKALAFVPGGDVPDVLSMSSVTDAHLVGESVVTTPRRDGFGPSTVATDRSGAPRFTPTPTGRRARGQLEYDVLAVCADYAANVFDWEACTPKLVSEEIGKRYAIEPPSTGAINAVWDRWEKLEFGTQAKKPSRFLEFTSTPSIDNWDAIKARGKRTAKFAKAEAKRGTLRPRGKK